MLESAALDHRNHHSRLCLDSTHSCLDNDHTRDASFRHRLHSLLAENFELKEAVARLQADLRASEDEKRDLRDHLKLVLEEMNANDRIIENFKNAEIQHHSSVERHLQDLAAFKEELHQAQRIISNLLEHNNNLETENQLIIEIKQKYAADLAKAKADLDALQASNLALGKQNECFSGQIRRLLEEVERLEEEIKTRRNDIQEYEKFVLSRLSGREEQAHLECGARAEALEGKYAKYKAKAGAYKRERDQLRFQLQQVAREVDAHSLRKYYSELE